MNNKLLLVEDSKETFQMVNQATSSIGELTWVKSLEEANNELADKSFDLIILDIGLPDGSGFELCSSIQAKTPETPIFILSAHTDLSEKVLGFSAGADDYITKPFNILELKARIEAKLKKQEILMKTGDILQWKEIEINKSSQEVKVLDNDEMTEVDLTALEFKLLTYFASQPEVVISRDKMLDDIWGQDVHVYSRSVDTHVSKLRKKLGPVADIIESVHGVGYKFTPTEL